MPDPTPYPTSPVPATPTPTTLAPTFPLTDDPITPVPTPAPTFPLTDDPTTPAPTPAPAVPAPTMPATCTTLRVANAAGELSGIYTLEGGNYLKRELGITYGVRYWYDDRWYVEQMYDGWSYPQYFVDDQATHPADVTGEWQLDCPWGASPAPASFSVECEGATPSPPPTHTLDVSTCTAPMTSAPTMPSPPTPVPTTPAPTTPAPTTQSPTTPAPIIPAPTTPTPTTPAPPIPAPMTPAPTIPAPMTPAPTIPAPSTPTPTAAATPAPTTPGPTTSAPSTPAPSSSTPSTSAPATPTTLAPSTPAPTTPAPTTPSTQAPTTPAPLTQAPSTLAPSTPAPSTSAPTTSAPSRPSTLTPLTRAPSTPAPSTSAPATSAPTTPITLASSTSAPTTPAPTATTTAGATLTPTATLAPEIALAPASTLDPGVTLTPTATLAPEGTVAPASILAPAVTLTPTATLAPESTLAPGATLAPTATLAPESTLAPTSTLDPGVTLTPTATLAPEIALAPASTLAPGATLTPTATLAPETTLAPASTLAPGVTLTPRTTLSPESTPAPASTLVPRATLTPTATLAPESTLAPASTLAPGVTLTPRTTLSPESTPAPASTLAPRATLTPTATLAPESTVAPGATLVPTATLAPESTLAPPSTLAPGVTLAPTATLAPESTRAPPSTAAPAAPIPRSFPSDDSSASSLDPSPTPGDGYTSTPSTAAPLSVEEQEFSTQASTPVTVAAGATSTLAVTGVAITTLTTLFGGAFGSAGVGGAGPTSRGADSGVSASVQDNNISRAIRQPSATLAVLLVAQIQFLALISLVTGATDSSLANFAYQLRWVNLWPPQNFAESFTPIGTPDGESSDESDVGQQDRDIDLEPESATSQISSYVFMGNFVLFVALLTGIFLVHVALASGVEAYWVAKKRATEEVSRARHLGTPLREVPVNVSRRLSRMQIQHDADSSQRALPGKKAVTAASGDNRDQAGATDVEGGALARAHRRNRLNIDKIAECREKSQSAWLHFPHIELIFLLFAFEGAVAAQVAAIREHASPAVFILAMLTLILYPVLMVVMVVRTFSSKVRPDDKIVFKAHASDDEDDDESAGPANGISRSTRSFASRVQTSLKRDHSMFAWANKGEWESVETSDKEVKRERDWFRIGFEPLFVDFTKNGSWFVVYTLIEWAALGVVGVLVDNNVLQLSLFCAMHAVSCLLLVVFKPFANRIVNGMGIALYGINAICMALLAVSADKWEGTSRAKGVDTAVMIIQIVILSALIIPIYVDTSFIMIGALKRKLDRSKRNKNADAETDEEKEEREFKKRYVRKSWARTWCTMLGKNFFACLRDTKAGIDAKTGRAPRPTAARSGPYPPLGGAMDEAENAQPRRLDDNTVGTVDTPLVVLSPGTNMGEHKTSL